MSETQQFILLPSKKGRNTVSPNNENRNFLMSLSSKVGMDLSLEEDSESLESQSFKVLDSIHEDGAKLIEVQSGDITFLKAQHPGVRIIPITYYYPMYVQANTEVQPFTVNARNVIKIKLISANGKPIPNAVIVAFTNYRLQKGVKTVSDEYGKAVLPLGKKNITLDRLYIYPEHSYWGKLFKDYPVFSGIEIKLKAIKTNFKDSFRHFFSKTPLDAGSGVTVGVIDTGVGPHKDLKLDGGMNMVFGEYPDDFLDNGEGHGTHVAGIIAAMGDLTGAAPGVKLKSYRVFGKDGDGATNYSIIKAIDQAVQDGCDLINMSLGGGSSDEAMMQAIDDAYENGTICFVATGNDGRMPVSFPASYSLSLGVGAMGRKDRIPKQTPDIDQIKEPFGIKDKNNFVAEFSNIGDKVDFIAPGVSIISTFPNDLYAVMSGTSMACPAATGIAAKLLAIEKQILQMPRNQARADAMIKFLSSKAEVFGFGQQFEGQGMMK